MCACAYLGLTAKEELRLPIARQELPSLLYWYAGAGGCDLQTAGILEEDRFSHTVRT